MGDAEIDVARQDVWKEFMDGVLRDYYSKDPGNTDPWKRASVRQAYQRFGRAGKYILTAAEGDPKKARKCVDDVVRRMQTWRLSFTLDTVAKWADEYFASPEHFNFETERMGEANSRF